MFKPAELFDLSQTAHAALFDGCEHAWDALKNLKAYLAATLTPGNHGEYPAGAAIGSDVFIGEGTVIGNGVTIQGPAIIGRNCQIRHGAFIRDNVIIGDRCVVGNSCEVKHSVLFNDCQVPHFNYVGDSILGHKAHLGAGVICSNLKSLPGNVSVDYAPDGSPFDTGLRKLGALVGDQAEIGCNSVLNPGSIIGRGAIVYPLSNWRGFLPANMIAKNQAAQEVVPRRPRSGA